MQLAVAGLSWGGAMSACIALACRLPVACMVGLGSDSPRVMVEGEALRWQIDWDALLRAGGHATVDEASREVLSVFRHITFGSLLESAGGDGQPAGTIGSVVQVQGLDDRYVSAEEGVQLHEQLRRAVQPDQLVKLEWFSGGHVVAFSNLTDRFVPACVRAVDAAKGAWESRQQKRQ
jgi:pimeloyl-ACP methyl ester carboxylesterase